MLIEVDKRKCTVMSYFFIKGGEILKICVLKGGPGTYSDMNNYHGGKEVDKRKNNSDKDDQLFSSRNFFKHLSCGTLCWAQDSVICSPFPWAIHI